MSDFDYSGTDPKTAMWLAGGVIVVALVMAAVLHNTLSIVLVVIALGDVALLFWLNGQRKKRLEK